MQHKYYDNTELLDDYKHKSNIATTYCIWCSPRTQIS